MKIPFEINLTDKAYVVTGAGGVLCSMFAGAFEKTVASAEILNFTQ